jgi:hypothetical protein
MKKPAVEPTKEEQLDALADANGGYWGPGHFAHHIDDWKTEVANDDTRMGYWEWVQKQLEG